MIRLSSPQSARGRGAAGAGARRATPPPSGASPRSSPTSAATAIARLLRYARQFDRPRRARSKISRPRCAAAAATVPADVRAAIRDRGPQHPRGRDAGRCRAAGALRVAAGVSVEQRVVPLDRVGCYVPGGRYPLPSSLLMTAIPAAAAGVREVVAVCPRPEPVVMAAALEAGVSRLFRVGGAHAVAALAYGTETVPRVDKIVGPGQPLRRRGQGAGRRRLRHRLLRRPDRDPSSSPHADRRRGLPPI